MKRILCSLAVAAVLASGSVRAQEVETATPVPPTPGQVNDPLLAGTEKFAKGAKEASEINMDQNTLRAMGGGDQGNLTKKLDFVVVRSYEYDQPGMYRQEDLDAIVSRLRDGTWSCMVHTKSAKESADICMRQGADNESSELILMVSEPKELSFIHVKGRMSIGDLQKAASGLSGGMTAPKTPTPPPPPPLKPR